MVLQNRPSSGTHRLADLRVDQVVLVREPGRDIRQRPASSARQPSKGALQVNLPPLELLTGVDGQLVHGVGELDDYRCGQEPGDRATGWVPQLADRLHDAL